MSEIDTFDIDSAVVRSEVAVQASAWAIGFDSANAVIDKGVATTSEVLKSVGIWECVDRLCGSICSISLAHITNENRLAQHDSRSFVEGVSASIKANRQLLGGQNV